MNSVVYFGGLSVTDSLHLKSIETEVDDLLALLQAAQSPQAAGCTFQVGPYFAFCLHPCSCLFNNINPE
jgi:hypothetical protein